VSHALEGGAFKAGLSKALTGFLAAREMVATTEYLSMSNLAYPRFETSVQSWPLPPEVDERALSCRNFGRTLWREGRLDALAFAVTIAAVPISIAVSESLLCIGLLLRLAQIFRGRASLSLPRIFWFWMAWAGLELVIWLASPRPEAGRGEISHLLLIASVFIAMPALAKPAWSVMTWRCLLTTATLGALFLIGDVISRLLYYQRELSVDSDPSTYLRSGGLLNHWMVFGTVQVVVFAGILAFCRTYPEQKRFWIPVLALNVLAAIVSLTRMVWVCCFVLLEADLFGRRSKLRWLGALIPLALFLLGPGFLRARVRMSVQPHYFANAERIQMLRVGWKMIKEHPLHGVGPGRVAGLYRQFLPPVEAVPAFYGHLHNNLVQIAAEFGIPVAAAGMGLTVLLFLDIRKAGKIASSDRDRQFLCRAGLLGLSGFVLAGMFDYTYGHSLGLIIVFFACLAPLLPTRVSDAVHQ
jgi:O-antigen ligase